MATFVLVPGAWLGGWAWRDVAARLRAMGHDVYPITLTGLGERVHLARPEVDLETHIADVVNTVRMERSRRRHPGRAQLRRYSRHRCRRPHPGSDPAARLRRLGPARGRDGDDRSLPARRVGGAAADASTSPARAGSIRSRDSSAGGRYEHCRPRGDANEPRSRPAPLRSRGPRTPSRCVSSTRTPRRHALPAGSHRLRRHAGSGRGRGATDRRHGGAAVALSGAGDRTLADVLGASASWRRCWTPGRDRRRSTKKDRVAGAADSRVASQASEAEVGHPWGDPEPS